MFKSALFLLVLVGGLAGCEATSLNSQRAEMGQSASYSDMLASLSTPGPIVFTKHLSARWQVDLSGLVNLDHEKAVAAGLKDKKEPIEIYTYGLQHPEFGSYLVDSGVSESFRDPATETAVSSLIKSLMGMDKLTVEKSTAEVADELGGIDGVFLTHIHLDHILGLTDLPSATKVFIGPGDTNLTDVQHLATQGSTDRLLGVDRVLSEWSFSGEGVIDVFGDGSLWAIHSPGHTPGTTAFIARTVNGPELMLGDTTHTKWGWTHGVEPGTFSQNQPQSVLSLNRLLELASQVPDMKVHPGHQSL